MRLQQYDGAAYGRSVGTALGVTRKDGVPTTYLVDTILREGALAVLATEPFLPMTPDTRVKQGRSDFAQLYEWYRYLGPHIWPLEVMRSSDVDEACKRGAACAVALGP